MSRLGPFDNAPQLVERKAGLIDMMVRDRPEVDMLQFYGARTLNAAYGNPTASGLVGAVTQADTLFTVGRSRQYRSPAVVRRRWSWYGEALQGMSRVAWDPADYVGDITTDLPSDSEYAFVRLQESRPTVGPAAATALVDASASVGAADSLTIMGVLFQGLLIGPGNPVAGTWDAAGAPGVAATELIAAINEPTTMQPALLAAIPVGVTVTASAGAGVDEVILTASVTDATGNLVTLAVGGAVVAPASLTGGGGVFLVVNGPVDTGAPKLGPIYVVPLPEFFGQVIPVLLLAGTAPDGTTAIAGSVPPLDLDMQIPNPMHIILPRPTSSITISNHDPANPLLVSAGAGTPMVTVGFDEDPLVVFGSFKEIFVAGSGGAVPFSVQAVVALGADL